MEYRFSEIESRWQQYWQDKKVFAPEENFGRPKYYVLDMFPYPSGSGLHVGHPLGYIASDIVARYYRHQGFNVLHPMGYDSFGLPAEQYAVETGQHPAVTTEGNIAMYRKQLDNIGFSFDWSREVRTSDPAYYKWTQWIFIQLFHSWYDKALHKARPITELIAFFEKEGNSAVQAHADEVRSFNADEWKAFTELEKEYILAAYRLAFLADTWVNWCPALGTVLANEEVKEGLSERGGHPVEKKKMAQWSLRITAYADRLLEDLHKIDWTDAIKEQQRNWIGKSEGALVWFPVSGHDLVIEVFTTRPDTIFGVSYLALAPDHEMVKQLTTDRQKSAIEDYVRKTAAKSERERMSEVKQVSGVFTGSFVKHPFTGEDVPVWIADYVLSGYGTGAVMAVPGHDSRDYAFARHFTLPVKEVVAGGNLSEEAYEAKSGKMMNSAFLDGLEVKEAISASIVKLENENKGKRKINYRLRDAIFSRQRYWGEPIPVYYEAGIARTLPEDELPLILPSIDKYMPTETGEPPLGRATDWKYKGKYEYELSTMPGWAGSSWYFLRYMDPHNTDRFASEESINYWKQVDLYMGGAEHATGHLLYLRFWTKFLFDLNLIPFDEPARKLINQGMIQGRSNLVYREAGKNHFISHGLTEGRNVTALHVDVNIVRNDILDLNAFKAWRSEYADATFELEDGKYVCGHEVEKMSKRWYNVVNPDDIVREYGADTLRLYEMFLGPLELSKPWNTNGIEGVSRFLKKLWRLYHTGGDQSFFLNDQPADKKALKALHRTIDKITQDLDRYSFNTVVSAFMILVNELSDLKCNNKEVLEPLIVLISPYAPHIAEELWMLSGKEGSVSRAAWPKVNPEFLKDDEVTYPVSFNGKTRFSYEVAADTSPADVEQGILADERTMKYLEGKQPKKVIVVPGRIINIVV